MPRGNPKPIEYEVDERGCHICISHSCNGRGYSQKRVKANGKWIMVTIVKYLWEQVNGPVSKGLEIRHDCDNRKCINLEHVQLGTRADNVADRVARGRSYAPIGEMHGRSKLTEDQVRFIRVNRFPEGQGLNGAELALMFGVSGEAISEIVNRKIWKHVR